MTDNVFRLPTNEAIGTVEPTEDGGHVLVGFDGWILSGADVNGLPISEPELRARYGEYAFRVPPAEEPAIRMKRRLDIRDAEEMSVDPEPEFEDSEADSFDLGPVALDISEQLDREAAKRRRPPFTRDEQQRVLERAQQDVQRGRRPDIAAILTDLEAEGHGVANLDTKNGRIQFAGQKLLDGEREERGQQLGEADPGSFEEYAELGPAERQAWIAERTGRRLVDHDGEEDER
jgi:hypothetical protein